MSNRLKAHLALFTANLIYGINYSVAKDVMNGFIGPAGFIVIRASGALLLFWLFALSAKDDKIDRKDRVRLVLAGLFGVAVNQIMFFEGLHLTTPINAAIIMTSNPVIVLLLAAVILKERINALRIAGIATGLAGAVFLTTYTPDGFVLPDFSRKTAMGDLFVLINAFSYALYLITVKPLMKRYRPITVIKWVFLYGLLFVLPVGWRQFIAIEWSSFTPVIWWEVAFVVVATTFLAYLLNIFALKNLNPSTVSIYIYLQPVLATLFSLLWANDHLTWYKAVAAAMIFAGVYLVSKPVAKTALPRT